MPAGSGFVPCTRVNLWQVRRRHVRDLPRGGLLRGRLVALSAALHRHRSSQSPVAIKCRLLVRGREVPRCRSLQRLHLELPAAVHGGLSGGLGGGRSETLLIKSQ